MFINNFEKNHGNRNISQMEQRSILSNVTKYIQYNRNPRDYFKLDFKALEQKNHRKLYNRLKEEDRQFIELDFGDTPVRLKGEYLGMYDGVMSEVLCTTKFDNNSYLSTTYLDKIDMTRSDKQKAEERFPISEQGYTVGKLLDGTECQIFLIQQQLNHLCAKYIIQNVNHYNCYQSLLPKLREFR